MGFRLDAATASQHRRTLYQNAQKHARQPTKRQLALCDWAFYATNLPAEEYNTEEISTLYRIRWQIELLFKLWKSEGHLDESHGKDWRVLCEFYAKLLGLILMNWLMLSRYGCLGGVSPVKMFRRIRQSIPLLMQALGNGNKQQIKVILELIIPKIEQIPKQHKRKKHPTIRQLLEKRKSNTPKKTTQKNTQQITKK